MRHREREAAREAKRKRQREEAAIVERVKVMQASVEDLRNNIKENTKKLQEAQQELAKTDDAGPPGELASQGIYKNAEDPDAAPKPKAAKKKRAPDDGAAGKKAAKK